MGKPAVILVGGFLGAGKTMLLATATERLTGQGKRVGLITDDQAPNLVDTAVLKERELGVTPAFRPPSDGVDACFSML